MVSRPSTIRKTACIRTRGCSLLGGEREQVSNICGGKEAVLGLEFRARGTRGRESGVETNWVEKEGGLPCLGCLVEGGDRRSCWQRQNHGGAGRLTNLTCGCFPQVKQNKEGWVDGA